MEGHTLISIIGTGMSKGKYEDTTYQFPDGENCPTDYFLEAILKSKYYSPVKKVILVGTTSSSWDVLIPTDNENTDLGIKIIDECKNNSFNDASKKELEKKLQEYYKIKFEIIIHTNEFTRENVENVFNKYLEIPGLLEPDTDIIFDITHGFRSMSLLIFQSMQVDASKIKGKKVKLIYGEYINQERTISYVRDLSKYWEYYEISSAIKLFEENFDGKMLAEKIKPHWEKGCNFLKRFSEIVECNFSLQLPDALKELKNALSNFDDTEIPQWVIGVRNTLAGIYKKLSQNTDEKYPIAKTVWEYSKLLIDRHLITQAVIALQVVSETAVAEKYDPSKVGVYKWFNGFYDKKKKIKVEGIGDKYLKKILNKNKELNSVLWKLEGLRNQIAHGGGKDEDGNYPHKSNIPGILNPMNDAIKELFIALDKKG